MPASFRQYRVRTNRYKSVAQPPQIDASHPFSRWIAHAFVFSVGFGVYDAVTGKFTRVTEASNMGISGADSYQGLRRTDGASTANGYIDVSSSAISPSFTIVSQFRSIHNGDPARSLLDDDNDSARKFQYRLDGTTSANSYLNFIYFNTTGSVFSSGTPAGSIKEGKIHVGCGRILSNGTLDVFLDGIKGTTGTVTGTPATTNNTFRIFNKKTSAAAFGGDIFLELVFNIGLSDDQIRIISNNPWQVFIPNSNYAYNKFKEGQGQTTRSSWMLGSSALIDVDSRYNILPISNSIQSQVIPEIDWSKPISKGLVFATEGSVPRYDFVTKTFGNTIGSGVSFDSGPSGKQISFSGTVADGAYSFGTRTDLSGATEATWDILVKFNSGDSHFFGQWDTNQAWLLQKSGTSLIWIAADDNSGNRRRWDCVVFPGAGTYRIIASWQGGANKCLYVNGIDKTSSATVINNVATSIGSTMDNLQLGTVNGGVDLNGSIVFARIWNRGLSDVECAELANSPYWGIFKTRIREIPVDNIPVKLWTPTIWTSKTRVSQPQTPLTTANDIRSWAMFNFALGKNPFNFGLNTSTRNLSWSERGSNSLVVSKEQVGVKNGSGGLQYGVNRSFDGFSPANSPMFCVLSITHGAYIDKGSSVNAIFSYGEIDAASGFYASVSTSNQLIVKAGNTSLNGPTLVAGRTYNIVFGRNSSGTCWLWVNGTLVANGTGATAADSSVARILFLLSDYQTTRYYQGTIALFAIGSSNPFEFGSKYSLNPWQIFQPTKHRIYTGI